MTTSFRTTIVLGVALYGSAAQLTSQAQSPPLTSAKTVQSRSGYLAAPLQSALDEYPLPDAAETGPTKAKTEATDPTAASTAGTPATVSDSSATTAAPASATVPLRN